MRYAVSLGLAALLFSATSARAQYFTPAPVDLTGLVPSGSSPLESAIDPNGEVFVWHPGSSQRFLTFLEVTCAIDCLNPDGYVALSEQAANPALTDQYVGLYSAGVLEAGLPDYPQTTNSILALASTIAFLEGEDKAFSLGRIVDGTPAEILQWVEEQVIVVHWQRLDIVVDVHGDTPVRYTTFVPEPSTIGLAALGVAALLFAGRRRAGGAAFSRSGAVSPVPHCRTSRQWRPAASLCLAALLFSATSARAQYFTPAPVDLTGKVPEFGSLIIGAAIDEHGELFVWDAYRGGLLTRLVIECEINCLKPDGYVALSEQAAAPGLEDTYVDLFGPTVLYAGLPDRVQAANQIVAINEFIEIPGAEDKAFSLGRIVDGTPEEIKQWVEDEQIIVRWEKIFTGINQGGEFAVRYTTFVPEPSAIGLAALGLAGLLFTRRRRAGATAGLSGSAGRV